MDLPRAAGAALVLGAVALYLRQQQEEAARRAMSGPAAPVPEMPHVVEAVVPLPPPNEGETLLDGSVISYRPRSRSGPPTIDVNVHGLKIRKLKFPGENG